MVLLTDRAALSALFRSTGGAEWRRKDNWDTGADLSRWFGVKVDAQGRVVRLALVGNFLRGTIPKELGKLTALQHLSMFDNQLSGTIPPELGKLAALETLQLQRNQLSGPIPQELGKLTAVKELNLNRNKLSGPVPEELGKLTAVKGLYLNSNKLSGHIPPQIGDLSSLEVLDLSWNKFDGAIPAQLGALNKLAWLYLSDNQLSALWDHSQDIHGIGHEEQTGSGSGGPVPSQLRRLLDVFDGAVDGLLLHSNPWAEPPESIVVKGAKYIREYFEDLFSEPCRIQRDCIKVVLVGQEGAGKTSLCRSMKARKAAPTGEWKENSTVFADVEPLVLEGASVRVYDCAGQVAYTGLLQMLLTPRSVCVLVCDAEAFEYGGSGTDGQRDGLGRRGTQMVLPRSWDIALTVLEALERGRDPVEMTLRKLANPDRRDTAETEKRRRDAYQGITLDELSAKWLEMVSELAKKKVTVINPEHALEGALSIREFDGSLVRHETYVFLDVVWLARILKPLLNHKDEETFDGLVKLGDTGDTCITLHDEVDIASWGRLKNEGVLEPRLARAIWPVGLSEYVLPTLLSLGLTFPLDNDPADGLVVLLRLGEERPKDVGKELDDFRHDHTAVLSATWKVFMGVPPGAIEKVLTRCCSIGALRTFWRFGVLVQGGFGAVGAGKTFALLVEYSREKTEIEMKVYGNIRSAAPWAALSLGISAVRTMCSDFPGLRWRASLKCPQHEQDMQISNTATRPGDKLLHGKTCNLCSSETGGLGAAATDLVEMVDVLQSGGEILRQVNRRFSQLVERYPALQPELENVQEA
eukprot:g1247.t2